MRLSRNYRRRNNGNVIVYVSISFHSRDVLCTLSRLKVRPGFRLFCACLALHYFAVYSVLGSFNCFIIIKQSLKATATSTIVKVAVDLRGDSRVDPQSTLIIFVRFSALFVSALPLLAKGHKTTT